MIGGENNYEEFGNDFNRMQLRYNDYTSDPYPRELSAFPNFVMQQGNGGLPMLLESDVSYGVKEITTTYDLPIPATLLDPLGIMVVPSLNDINVYLINLTSYTIVPLNTFNCYQGQLFSYDAFKPVLTVVSLKQQGILTLTDNIGTMIDAVCANGNHNIIATKGYPLTLNVPHNYKIGDVDARVGVASCILGSPFATQVAGSGAQTLNTDRLIYLKDLVTTVSIPANTRFNFYNSSIAAITATFNYIYDGQTIQITTSTVSTTAIFSFISPFPINSITLSAAANTMIFLDTPSFDSSLFFARLSAANVARTFRLSIRTVIQGQVKEDKVNDIPQRSAFLYFPHEHIAKSMASAGLHMCTPHQLAARAGFWSDALQTLWGVAKPALYSLTQNVADYLKPEKKVKKKKRASAAITPGFTYIYFSRFPPYGVLTDEPDMVNNPYDDTPMMLQKKWPAYVVSCQIHNPVCKYYYEPIPTIDYNNINNSFQDIERHNASGINNNKRFMDKLTTRHKLCNINGVATAREVTPKKNIKKEVVNNKKIVIMPREESSEEEEEEEYELTDSKRKGAHAMLGSAAFRERAAKKQGFNLKKGTSVERKLDKKDKDKDDKKDSVHETFEMGIEVTQEDIRLFEENTDLNDMERNWPRMSKYSHLKKKSIQYFPTVVENKTEKLWSIAWLPVKQLSTKFSLSGYHKLVIKLDADDKESPELIFYVNTTIFLEKKMEKAPENDADVAIHLNYIENILQGTILERGTNFDEYDQDGTVIKFECEEKIGNDLYLADYSYGLALYAIATGVHAGQFFTGGVMPEFSGITEKNPLPIWLVAGVSQQLIEIKMKICSRFSKDGGRFPLIALCDVDEKWTLTPHGGSDKPVTDDYVDARTYSFYNNTVPEKVSLILLQTFNDVEIMIKTAPSSKGYDPKNMPNKTVGTHGVVLLKYLEKNDSVRQYFHANKAASEKDDVKRLISMYLSDPTYFGVKKDRKNKAFVPTTRLGKGSDETRLHFLPILVQKIEQDTKSYYSNFMAASKVEEVYNPIKVKDEVTKLNLRTNEMTSFKGNYDSGIETDKGYFNKHAMNVAMYALAKKMLPPKVLEKCKMSETDCICNEPNLTVGTSYFDDMESDARAILTKLNRSGLSKMKDDIDQLADIQHRVKEIQEAISKKNISEDDAVQMMRVVFGDDFTRLDLSTQKSEAYAIRSDDETLKNLITQYTNLVGEYKEKQEKAPNFRDKLKGKGKESEQKPEKEEDPEINKKPKKEKKKKNIEDIESGLSSGDDEADEKEYEELKTKLKKYQEVEQGKGGGVLSGFFKRLGSKGKSD